MRSFVKTTGVLLAAAIMLTGCQSSKEKYTFRDTGIEQLNAGNYSEAIASFDEALNKSDGLVGTFEVDVLKYRAEAEYKAEDYSAAVHTYEILSEVDEARPEYTDMQNMLYIKTGDLDKAMAAYQAAYGPETGETKDAKAAKDAKDTGDNQQMILLSLGQALTEAGRFDDARALYDQAVASGMQSDELYNRMGLGELEAGNIDQALSFFEQGMQMPDDGARQKLLYNQAAAYEQKQDFAAALELLETYAATYGSTPEVDKEITFLKSRQ